MDRANLEYEIIGPGPAYFFRAGTRAPESDQTLLYRIVSDRPVPNAILAPEGWGTAIEEFYKPTKTETIKLCFRRAFFSKM